VSDEISFFDAALEVLDPLFSASNLLNVIDRAERSGVLAALRDGADLDTLVAVTGLGEQSARTMCVALTANGIAESVNGDYRLTRHWRALLADNGMITLASMIARNRVMDRMLAGQDTDYFRLDAHARMAFARGVSPNPYSSALVAQFAQETVNDPWWASMADGGRHLELGCGLAGRLLTLLQALPKLRAVGVELDPELADEARRRADELGVADRVEIITSDATTFTSDELFDFGFWSQWFFPSATRPGALATLFACVRRGGAVRAPVFGLHDQIAQDPTGRQARSYAVDRIMLDAWGVPERTPEQLHDEFEAAGFIDATIVTREGGVTSVYARRP
jgi:hypothetical protein